MYTLHLGWSTALNEHDNGFGLWTFNVPQDIVISIKAKFVFNDCLQLISHNDLPMWWHLNGLSLILFILCWMWSSKVEAQTDNVGRPALILHLTTAVHKELVGPLYTRLLNFHGMSFEWGSRAFWISWSWAFKSSVKRSIASSCNSMLKHTKTWIILAIMIKSLN